MQRVKPAEIKIDVQGLTRLSIQVTIQEVIVMIDIGIADHVMTTIVDHQVEGIMIVENLVAFASTIEVIEEMIGAVSVHATVMILAGVVVIVVVLAALFAMTMS